MGNDICVLNYDRLHSLPDLNLDKLFNLLIDQLNCADPEIKETAANRINMYKNLLIRDRMKNAKLVDAFANAKDIFVIESLFKTLVESIDNKPGRSVERKFKLLTILFNKYDRTKDHRIKNYLAGLIDLTIKRLRIDQAENGLKFLDVEIKTLQGWYEKCKSRDFALLLLSLGRPYPYYEDYSNDDLKTIGTQIFWPKDLTFKKADLEESYNNLVKLFDTLIDLGDDKNSLSLFSKIMNLPIQMSEDDFRKRVEKIGNIAHLLIRYDFAIENKYRLDMLNILADKISKGRLSDEEKSIVCSKCAPLLFDNIPGIRSAAVKILGALGNKKAIPLLRLALGDVDKGQIPQEELELVKDIGVFIDLKGPVLLFKPTVSDNKIKESGLSDKTKRMLMESFDRKTDSSFKSAVIVALGQLNDKGSIGRLKQMLNEEDNTTIVAALIPVLANLNEVFADELIKIFHNDRYSDEVKLHISSFLIKKAYWYQPAVKFLLDNLYRSLEGHTKVDEEILSLLSEISALFKKGCEKMLEKYIKSENKVANFFALECLVRLADKNNLPLILPMLKSPYGIVRLKALEALMVTRDIKDEKTISILEEQLEYWKKAVWASQKSNLNINPLLKMRKRDDTVSKNFYDGESPIMLRFKREKRMLLEFAKNIIPELESYIKYSCLAMRDK